MSFAVNYMSFATVEIREVYDKKPGVLLPGSSDYVNIVPVTICVRTAVGFVLRGRVWNPSLRFKSVFP